MRERRWPWVVLAAFAVAALMAGGIVGFILGFVAALLVVDHLWPVTGMMLSDAQTAYARQARRRRLDELSRRVRRRPAHEGRLEHLPPEREAGCERRALGTHSIPLDSIVGTTERDKATAFDDCFRPPAWSRGRWQAMWVARSRGMELAPISVYRVGDRHFVRDGHHRVSVARALEESTIDAEVVELRLLAAGHERER